MTTVPYRDILSIKECAARAKEEGLRLSEHTIRRLIHEGIVPCRIVGRTYLISWSNLMHWVSCADGCDNRTA